VKWPAWLERFLWPRAYEQRINGERMAEWRRECERARIKGVDPPPPPNKVWVK